MKRPRADTSTAVGARPPVPAEVPAEGKRRKKSKRRALPTEDAGASSACAVAEPVPASSVSSTDDAVSYAYEVDDADHCETPAEAYRDIAPLLHMLAERLGKAPDQLAVYDPFFCEGSMKERMAAAGFPNVYNRMEDFYEVQRQGRVPTYDVLVTNPPYSGDHMPALLRFCAASSRPFLLLMPHFVYAKEYYDDALTPPAAAAAATAAAATGTPASASRPAAPLRPFYLVPSSRYQYTTPKGRRQAKSAVRTSPFPTMWFCHMGPHTPVVLRGWREQVQGISYDSLVAAKLERQAGKGKHKPGSGREGGAAKSPALPAPPAATLPLRFTFPAERPAPTLCRGVWELPSSMWHSSDPRLHALRNAKRRERNKERKKQAKPREAGR